MFSTSRLIQVISTRENTSENKFESLSQASAVMVPEQSVQCNGELGSLGSLEPGILGGRDLGSRGS